MTADDIVTAARALVGVPFKHQGRTRNGLDCAGLVVHVAATLGLKYTDHGGYARSPSDGLLESALDMQPCLELLPNKADMQAGDVLLMRFKEPQHLGIYTGENIIHSYSTVGKVCEHRLADVWKARIMRVYRFKGTE